MIAADRPICGGFFIAHPVARPDYMSSALIPNTILTISTCITDTLPDYWTLDWKKASEDERRRLEAIWGIDSDRLATIEGWASEAYSDKRLLWTAIFPTLDAARSLLERLDIAPERAVVIGIGLHPSECDEFLREEAIPDQVAQIGLVEMIQRRGAMPEGGRLLGWEILGCEYGGIGIHSWLCNGLEVVVNERLGIRPNEYGLLDNWADAAEVARLCNDPETGAEPVAWWAWAIVQYPTHRSADRARFVEEEPRVPLADHDRDRFLSNLDNPPEPNQALKRAFARHSRLG